MKFTKQDQTNNNMNAYKKYKNRLEKFLQTERGKRFINFAYSIGAAIVILGAMFKLLHFPFGNELLFIGMITEVIVFTLSAFDTPIRDYNWDKVFPALTSDNLENLVGLNNIFQTNKLQESQQSSITQRQTTQSESSQEFRSQEKVCNTLSNQSSVSNIDLTPQTEEYSRQLENLKEETEKMAKQLKELNEVYSRMLKAMTTNREH